MMGKNVPQFLSTIVQIKVTDDGLLSNRKSQIIAIIGVL